MKSNYKKKVPIVTTPEQLENIVREAIKEKQDELYKKVATDIAAQLFALVLSTLEVHCGWKRKRLRAFVEAFQSMAVLTIGGNVAGHEIDARKIMEHCKDVHGIDVYEELNDL